MSRLTVVCEELDKVLMNVMATLDELSALRNKYSDVVSEGYFYMSQARHTMGGPSTVSSLQYDARMEALVRLESNNLEADTSYDALTKLLASSKELSSIDFQVSRQDPTKPSTKVKRSDESQLRRRNVDKGSVEDVPLSKEPQETVFVNGHEECTVRDPLNWFGVLVPPYLRRSQDHFKQCVLLAVELAGAQTKLETFRRRYRELLKEKKELVDLVGDNVVGEQRT